MTDKNHIIFINITSLTQHIKKLKTIASSTISTKEMSEILNIIEKYLKREMRRRNLLTQPPSLLGYSEFHEWNKDSFQDIIHDCYEYAILTPTRCEALKAQISFNKNIDGLVYSNISNFLRDRQRAHDPKGYNIFKNIEAVLQDLSRSGEVSLDHLRDNKKIRNETICTLVPPSSRLSLPDVWLIKQKISDHKKFGEISKNAVKLGDKGQKSIAMLIQNLRESGINAFQVQNFVDILKDVFRNVDKEISISDIEQDPESDDSKKLVPADILKLSISNHSKIELNMDIENRYNNLKDGIEKQKIQKKRKDRLHSIITLLFHKMVNGEYCSVTAIAREMGASKSTISEDLTLIESIAEKINRKDSNK